MVAQAQAPQPAGLPPGSAPGPAPALLMATSDLMGLVHPGSGQPVTLEQLAVPPNILSCELQARTAPHPILPRPAQRDTL